jgi:hypothetical protein
MPNPKPITTRIKTVRRPIESDPGLVWGPLNSLLLGLGLALLVVGFWTLARGSLTLAPVCLVLGYVVFIPAALLLRGRGQDTAQSQGE